MSEKGTGVSLVLPQLTPKSDYGVTNLNPSKYKPNTAPTNNDFFNLTAVEVQPNQTLDIPKPRSLQKAYNKKKQKDDDLEFEFFKSSRQAALFSDENRFLELKRREREMDGLLKSQIEAYHEHEASVSARREKLDRDKILFSQRVEDMKKFLQRTQVKYATCNKKKEVDKAFNEKLEQEFQELTKEMEQLKHTKQKYQDELQLLLPFKKYISDFVLEDPHFQNDRNLVIARYELLEASLADTSKLLENNRDALNKVTNQISELSSASEQRIMTLAFELNETKKKLENSRLDKQKSKDTFASNADKYKAKKQMLFELRAELDQLSQRASLIIPKFSEKVLTGLRTRKSDVQTCHDLGKLLEFGKFLQKYESENGKG